MTLSRVNVCRSGLFIMQHVRMTHGLWAPKSSYILHPCMAACAAPQSPALARLEIERAVTGRAARVPIEPSVVPGCARACAACVVCVCSACPKAPKVVDGAVMALIAQDGAQSDVCQPGAQSSQPAGLSLSAARSAYPPPWLSVGAGWAAAGSPCARGAAPARGYGWGWG